MEQLNTIFEMASFLWDTVYIRFFYKGYTFCTLIVKVKLSVTLLCVYVYIAWKGHYCVERDVKP